MRITNSMMSNNVLLNINRNAQNVNKYYMQLASTKKFLYPSDDPIAASRALKFRTVLAENEQYQKNVSAGVAWTEVTEDGMKEVTEILKIIRDLAVKADAGESIEDKQTVANEIRGLWTQLAQTMNKSYLGRYIYSGYRTDEPGVFINNDPTLEVTGITQNFTSDALERTEYYHKYSDTGYTAGEAIILKLPYTDCDKVTVNGNSVTGIKSLSDPDCYAPGASDIFYIPETGELVFGSQAAIDEMPCEVVYDKTGFKKDDLNPKVYFTCDVDGKHYTMDNQDIEYEFSVGVRFPVNSLAKDIVTGELYGDLMSFVNTFDNMTFSSYQDLYVLYEYDNSTTPPTQRTENEIKALITEQQDKEREMAEKAMDSRINNLIESCDKYLQKVADEQTDLGTRMTRIDLLKDRLKTDALTYSELQGKNEDVDLEEAAMKLSMAEYAYQASMQIGMSMLMLSLMNFM